VTSFLYNHGANVTTLHEYTTDPRNEGGPSPATAPIGEGDAGDDLGGPTDAARFFMRVELTAPSPEALAATFEDAFDRVVAQRYAMRWRLSRASHRKRVAVLASKQDHALLELLWRHRRGELHCDLTQVIANHPDHEGAVRELGVPYHHVPVTPATREAAEARILELLGDDTELVVLARYMQILSPAFVARYPNRIINIHHSFLPAFVGARPYHQAYDRGVKIIGATAHYVTDILDDGPIIEQDVVRVSHRETPKDLIRIGRSIEREVLARAVRYHLDDRVIVHGRKTVVFT